MNLNQITIPVKNVEKSIEFYQKLGLKLIVHSNSHYARFECPKGNTTFSLHQVESLFVGEGIWIYFEVENVDITIQELETKGIAIEMYPVDQPWSWREARIKDMDNHQIIIYFAGNNRLDPPWRIK